MMTKRCLFAGYCSLGYSRMGWWNFHGVGCVNVDTVELHEGSGGTAGMGGLVEAGGDHHDQLPVLARAAGVDKVEVN